MCCQRLKMTLKSFVVGGAEVDRQPFLGGVLMRNYGLQVNQNFFYLRVGFTWHLCPDLEFMGKRL